MIQQRWNEWDKLEQRWSKTQKRQLEEGLQAARWRRSAKTEWEAMAWHRSSSRRERNAARSGWDLRTWCVPRRSRVQEELNMIHYPRAAACMFTSLRAEESNLGGTMMSLSTTTKWQQRAPSWSTTLGLRHVSYTKERRSSRRARV